MSIHLDRYEKSRLSCDRAGIVRSLYACAAGSQKSELKAWEPEEPHVRYTSIFLIVGPS